MLELHPKLLSKNGRPEFAVLPYDEFIERQVAPAEARDLIDLRAAKAEEADVPGCDLAEAKRRLGI